jgi:septal ring factor EnvC (AmiA/AmiB activator)
MTASLLIAAVLLAAGPPKEVLDQRAQVEAKLQSQSEALKLLQGKKVSVLAVLDAYDRLAHGYRAVGEALAEEVKALEAERTLQAWQEQVSAKAVAEEVKKLGPRLRSLDRLLRRNPLDALLSAKDFASLVWRARALSTITRGDLAALERLERSLAAARSAKGRLERLDRELSTRRALLAQDLERARKAKVELTDALGWLEAEASQASRVLGELKAADADLARMIARLSERPATSGFGALKGKLPLPTDGHIEVGYGDVLNPKFNTVTLHKGLDIRAPAGTPVRAVAEGRVVFAGWLRGYGNLVIVDQGNGFHTLDAHLARFAREVGEAVKAGDVLGEVGDSGSLKGAFLYFEIRERGEAVDPSSWLSLR